MTRGFLLIALSLLPSCVDGDISTSELQGHSPVVRFRVVDSAREGRSVAVYLEAKADWRSLVDLKVFEGFRPAMSHEEARMSVGPPDEIQDSRYLYDRPHGRVTVDWVVDRSGGKVFEQWQVSASPNDNRLQDVFGADLLRQLEPLLRERSEVVLLHPSSYPPVLRVYIRQGQVESVTWYGE